MIFLGIDCGTQSTKTIALDWDTGEVLASAQKAYGFVPNLPPGAMEQHPKDWIDAAEQSIGEVIAKLGARKEEIRGIGVSGQQHGLVVLDKDDQVVRPAKLWNDTTTGDQCDQITEHFGGPAAVIALVGNTMRTGYTAPKILWLRQNEPENWKKTQSVLLPHDYLNFWLTGVKKMEFGDASGTALLDVETRQWSTKVVDYIAEDLSGKAPPANVLEASPRRPAQRAVPEMGSFQGAFGQRGRRRQHDGRDRHRQYPAWGGDREPGNIGNSLCLFRGANHRSAGRSGRLLRQHRQLAAADLHAEPHARHRAYSQVLSAGTTRGSKKRSAPCRPVVMAFCCSPTLRANARPICPMAPAFFTDLTLANFTAAHMARAAFEGVTLGLGYGLARFRELGMHPSEIRLTGGGSNSRLWRKMCADVFGVPTVCLQSGEGAGLGGAVQAGWVWNKEHGSDATLAEICDRLIKVDESSRNEPDARERRLRRML